MTSLVFCFFLVYPETTLCVASIRARIYARAGRVGHPIAKVSKDTVMKSGFLFPLNYAKIRILSTEGS